MEILNISRKKMTDTRIEYDGLGKLEIPAKVYWGIHTARAMKNFPFNTKPVSPVLIKSAAMVKKAALAANFELNYIEKSIYEAINQACTDIIGGKLIDQFPVDSMQGGAGTSFNMNLNEVIANRSLELLNEPKGNYKIISPIEHINLHQSTNDVYPTAFKIATIFEFRRLSSAVEKLQGSLQLKEKEFAHILTIGRTEMQPAVPVTLGSQFASFAEAIARDRWRAFKAEERLRYVNIGGTAVGTGLTAPRSYIFLVIEKLRDITSLGLARAEQLTDASSNIDVFCETAGILASNAANISKIAQDLRLLHFTGEIMLPALQSGSSIMPGKVNPVICEALISVSIKVRANLNIINETASRGSQNINEYLPLTSFAMLESLDLLISASEILAEHIIGISADEEKCRQIFNNSESIITAFLPEAGYLECEKLIYEFKNGYKGSIREFLDEKFGSEKTALVLDSSRLMALGHKKTN